MVGWIHERVGLNFNAKNIIIMYIIIISLESILTTLIGLFFNVIAIDCVFWWQVWYYVENGINIYFLQNVLGVVKLIGIIAVILFSIDVMTKLEVE